MGSNKRIFLDTSCIKSLSEEIIVTFAPDLIISLAYVAIKSSASKLICSTDGTLNASTDFLIYSNWGAKSSGGSDLFAL